MFLEKRLEKQKVGTQLVPFCEDCESQDIETVQTCKKCGSHNIKSDWFDERSQKPKYEEREVYIYKCDRCNKEFNGFETPNIISYCDGEFVPYKVDDAEKEVSLDKDLCRDCMNDIVSKLHRELYNIISTEHILGVVDSAYKEVHNDTP